MATRRTTLKPDPRGDYRPYIGVRKDGKQQRFNLGADHAEAERRRDRIQQVYRESVVIRQHYGDQPASWTDAALHAAKLIQQGFTHVPIPSPHVVNEAAGEAYDIGQYDSEWSDHEPFAMVWSHTISSRHYPSVNWVLPDDKSGHAALELGRVMFDVQARRQARMMKAQAPEKPVAGTFHEALDAYDRFIETDVAQRVAPSTRVQRQSQVKYLKRDHADTPLAFLDLNGCRSLFDHWTARPPKENGADERYSNNTCKHRISELSMFFDWLHGTDEFDWRKPPDFDAINKVIAKDRKKKSIRELVSKPTFSVDQLATINAECRPLERLLLYLGLNCCFGAAESGRLDPDDLFIHQKNPLEHMWVNYGFRSDESESWIAYLRPKTDVAGCWWLWPETVEALEDWQNERPASDSSRIILSRRGKPLYRDHSKNAQSGFGKLWTDLLERVRVKHAEVPVLPFGTLRDQFSDWSVYQGESESGSMALAHGTPFKDDLLACYANRPFPLLFDLQKRYRAELQPVFEATQSSTTASS